jgi:hypothetical protein
MRMAELVKRLLAAGASPEIVTIAVTAFEEAVTHHDAKSKDAVRAKRYRDRKRDASRDANVTRDAASLPASPSSSPPKPPLLTTSSPNPASLRSAPPALPVDDKAILFAEGQRIMAGFGISKDRSGPLIGGWLKRDAPLVILHAIEQARDFAVSNPAAYIATILNKGQSNVRGKQSLSELAHDMAEEVRERERESDLGRAGTDERSRRCR